MTQVVSPAQVGSQLRRLCDYEERIIVELMRSSCDASESDLENPHSLGLTYMALIEPKPRDCLSFSNEMEAENRREVLENQSALSLLRQV